MLVELNSSEATVVVVGIHLNEVSQLILIVGLLIIFVSLARLAWEKFPYKFGPESAYIIVVGCVLGVILFLIGFSDAEVLTFNAEIFFLLLIPPIIFESGYHLDTKSFFKNIGLILSFALVGTLINAVVIGVVLFLLNPIFRAHLGLFEALAFGSLISAVDPVAVIAIFDEIHVNETLNILVFGESVLNDAVSIVLYNVFSSLIGVTTITWVVPGLAITKFFWVSIGGVVLGIVMALLCAFLTRFTGAGKGHIYLVEPLFILLFALLAYTIAEVFLMSGIVAILFCGIVMNRYVEMNIHHKSHTTNKFLIKMIAMTADTVVFAYLGINTVFHLTKGAEIWDPVLIVATLILILFNRTILTYAITFIANRVRRTKVSFRDQFIIAYSGLRGAIAFALAFIMDEEVESKDYLITTTLVVIFFTVFILGTTVKPILALLGVKKSSAHKKTLAEKTLMLPANSIIDCIGLIVGHSTETTFSKIWGMVDKIITRIVVRELHEDEEDLLDSMIKVRKKSAANLHDDEYYEHKENVMGMGGRVNPNRVANPKRAGKKKEEDDEKTLDDLGLMLDGPMKKMMAADSEPALRSRHVQR